VFSFSGDDDMWVFINRQLAIDLGGLHQRASAEVALDDIAPQFGLTTGQSYPLHFFFAERHTLQSTFTLRTSIADAGSCN
jgi:fibro-slime domain-containing protein